ncbi:MAG TPA: hypothetical protein VFW07_12000 [Parafilimonas sp.]|nr:hypothetical protein [Parafilimonas sp.]
MEGNENFIQKLDEIENKLSEFLTLDQYIKLREEILKEPDEHSFIVVDDFVVEMARASISVYTDVTSIESARETSIKNKCFIQYMDKNNIEHSFYKGFKTGPLLTPAG